MTVKITLEFPNADAAIVALAKLSKADGVTMTPEGPRKERKGRADKGRPRGPHGSPPERDGPPAPEPTPPAAKAEKAPAKPAAPEAPGVVTGAAIVPEADAQKALEKLFEAAPPKGGIEAARTVMAKFGVTRLRDLPEDKRGAFVSAVEEALK